MIQANEVKKIKQSFFSKLKYAFILFLFDKAIKKAAKNGLHFVQTKKEILIIIFMKEEETPFFISALKDLGYIVSPLIMNKNGEFSKYFKVEWQ